MTPRLVVQGGATIQILDGFQSNPYRRVLVGSQRRTPQEQRARSSASATPSSPAWPTRCPSCAPRRWRWCASTTTAGRCARSPPTSPATKYLGQSMLLTLRGHYHLQSGASFYRNAQRATRSSARRPVLDGRPRAVADGQLPARRQARLPAPPAAGALVLVRRDGAGRQVRALALPLPSVYAPNADRKFAHIVQGAFALRF